MRVTLCDDDIIDLADAIKDQHFQNYLRMFAFDFWGPSVLKVWITVDKSGSIRNVEAYGKDGALKPDVNTTYLQKVFVGINRYDGFEMMQTFNNAFQDRMLRLPRPHRSLPPSGTMMYDLNCDVSRSVVGEVFAEVYVDGE